MPYDIKLAPVKIVKKERGCTRCRTLTRDRHKGLPICSYCIDYMTSQELIILARGREIDSDNVWKTKKIKETLSVTLAVIIWLTICIAFVWKASYL